MPANPNDNHEQENDEQEPVVWNTTFRPGMFHLPRDAQGNTTPISVKDLEFYVGRPIASTRSNRQKTCTFCRDWSEFEDAYGDAYPVFDHPCIRRHYQCGCHPQCGYAFQLLECLHPPRTHFQATITLTLLLTSHPFFQRSLMMRFCNGSKLAWSSLKRSSTAFQLLVKDIKPVASFSLPTTLYVAYFTLAACLMFDIVQTLCALFQDCMDEDDHGQPLAKRRHITQYWGLSSDDKELLGPFVQRRGSFTKTRFFMLLCLPCHVLK